MSTETENLLRSLARIDTDGQSAEHVANLAVMYAEKARRILAKPSPAPDGVAALRAIKYTALTAKDGGAGLALVTRICINAGVRENVAELENMVPNAAAHHR